MITAAQVYAFRRKIETVAKKLDDTEALDAIELFPSWKEGIAVVAGDRYQYDGHLYKVLQSHTTQADWTPDKTASLFVIVQADSEAGTIDNPYEFVLNMELVEGKYYLDDSVKYLCTRSLAASYWPLAQLVGQYVEVVA